MNSYYLTLVLNPEMTEESRKALLDSMKKRVLGEDGKIVKEDLWGLRELAYPIKRSLKGFFAHFEIDTNPKNAKGLDKQLKVEENLLRYLLIRV